MKKKKKKEDEEKKKETNKINQLDYKIKQLNYIKNNFDNIISCLNKKNKINDDGKIINFIDIYDCIKEPIPIKEDKKEEKDKKKKEEVKEEIKIAHLLAATNQLNPEKPPLSDEEAPLSDEEASASKMDGGSSFPRIASLLAASQINMPPLLSPISSFYEKYIKYKSKYLKLQKIKSLKY